LSGPDGNLGQKAASGFFWLILQTILQKILSACGVFVLAWLLVPADFGIVGLAVTISTFIYLVNPAWGKEVLTQRHEAFETWANPAFWLTTSAGLIVGGIHIAAGPLGAMVYGDSRLTGLVWVLGCAPVFNGAIHVAQARLRIDMRFRVSSQVMLAAAAATLGLSIFMARLGFGPYSIVVPRVIVPAVQAVWLWRLARPPIRWHLDLGKWKSLLTDMGMLALGNVFLTIIAQGDYATLGLFQSASIVGVYYFAFNLSMQTTYLFALQLWEVLMPVLAKLKDQRQYQTHAFLRAARLLAIITVPCTLLQAALAEPLIRLFFNAKWIPSIPVLQALSVGMTFYAIGAPANGLLAAQGRFRSMMWFNLWSALGFLGMVVPSAWWCKLHPGLGEPATVTGVVVAVFYGLSGIANIRLAIRNDARGWRDVWKVYAGPIGAAVATLGPVTILTYWLTEGSLHADWIRLAVIPVASGLLYLAAIRLAAPQDWRELGDRFKQLRQR
jgi:O-antigen/teichoic acid export membrane protein